MSKHILSKSTYMRGIKCHKSLYLNKHGKDLRDETSDSQQFIFDQGTSVGQLAQELFPKGIDLTPESFYDYSESIARTEELISKKEKVIYEAAFVFDNVLCAIDILVYDGKSYKAYEVKGSTSVSDTYILDASLQYYVITNCGVKLNGISIIHINNEYVRKGKLNIKELFTIESIHEQVLEQQQFIPENIKTFKGVLSAKKTPSVDIGSHCGSPYQCDFTGHCWKHVPEYSIFDIANLRSEKKFDLYKKGIVGLNQITKEVEDKYFNDKQRMQLAAELDGRSYVDKKSINQFTSELNYPLYFLDFETMMPAIPLFDNARPFQQLVFQYSMHLIEKRNAEAKHFEFLAKPEDGDPRKNFLIQLIKECGTKGDILVYNIGFEKGRLNELAIDFPEFSKQIAGIIDRLKDLMVPFFQRWYYTPAMKGSYSIKVVLPALVPELSYGDLEIQEGGTASSVFAEMAAGNFKGDVEKTRKALLAYCHLDTLAMVKIFEKLKGV